MDRITTAAVNTLVILTAVLAFILIFMLARRRHVTIAEVSNGTGHADLDRYVDGASAEFRLAVGREMENAIGAVRGYHEKVLGNVADRCYALDLPEMRDALINRQDDTLDRLAASLENGGSRNLASQLQTLAGAIVRPRGATVGATIYQTAAQDDRLGIAVEVVSPASRFAQRHLLWETRKPARKEAPAIRIDTLLQPAARCAAIELAAWVLQRQPTRFSLRHRNQRQLRHRRRRQEGLARNMTGLLMGASASDFSDFAGRFREFSLDEFKAAATLLPKEYQPHYNLAEANEAAGMGAADSNERYKFFTAAADEYDAAARVCEKLPAAGRADVLRKIEVGCLHAKLVSKIPKLRQNALSTLADKDPPDVAADWPADKPRRSRRRAATARGAAGSALDDMTAECLYNSACVYALAADAARGRDYRTKWDAWDLHARRLLGAALVRDGSRRYLWGKAGTDPDLRRLTYHFDEFTARLREHLVDDHPGPGEIDRTVRLVDEVRTDAGWIVHAPVDPWWSRAAPADALRRVHRTR